MALSMQNANAINTINTINAEHNLEIELENLANKELMQIMENKMLEIMGGTVQKQKVIKKKTTKRPKASGAGASGAGASANEMASGAGSEGASTEGLKKDSLDLVNVEIPTLTNYKTFKEKKNSVSQLKMICAHYKLKMTGNKEQLTNSIYNHLNQTGSILKIQRAWKKYCWKRYHLLHGPARHNRALCVNETEFYTMDSLTSIPYTQFFSYKDKDDMIYGFDILYLNKLINKRDEKNSGCASTNPYNRKDIPNRIKFQIKKYLQYGTFIGKELEMQPKKEIVKKNTIEMRIKSLFHEMDILGNYTNSDWFLSLDKFKVTQFMKYLYDIWDYRASIEERTKMEICPPNGNPFMGLNTFNLMDFPLDGVLMVAANAMEQFILRGINTQSKVLGCNYVLCALTLVSPAAAEALPWLYYSVSNA
jgi:hypothetical protein